MPSCAACGTDLGEGAVARPDGLFLCDACNARVHPPDEPAAIRRASDTTRPSRPPIPWATYWIVFANVMVFFAMMIFIGTDAFSPTSEALLGFGADYGPRTVLKGEYWRIITCMFVHAGLIHIAMNMYVLFDVGPVAEVLYGRRRFMCMYMLAGVGGSLASLWWSPAIVSVGASGAIFGVVGALLAFSQRHKDRFSPEMLKRHTKSIMMFIVYNVGFGLMVPGIDVAAHAGGFIAGFLAGAVVVPEGRGSPRFSLRLVGGLAAFTLVFGVASAKLDWRVRNSPAVLKRMKAEALIAYIGNAKALMEAQDKLGEQLGRSANQSPGEGTTERVAAARANLDAFSTIRTSDPEVAELNAMLVKRGEVLLAMAQAAAKPLDALSAAERATQVKRFGEQTEQFTRAFDEFVERYGLKKR
jgi:rhomboid protease GluP